MTRKRAFALCLALAMLMSVMGGVVSAAPIPPAGENGYVSLHTYVSKTNDPSIIKVTHTVSAKIEIAPKKVVFVLDDSGSMSNGIGTPGNNASNASNREMMAPFGADVYNYAGWTAGYGAQINTPNLSSPGALASDTSRGATSLVSVPFYDWDGSDPTTQRTGPYKTRWQGMVQNAVPAAIDAMWGSNPSIAEKIEIAMVTFANSAIKTTGGFIDYNETNSFTPSGSNTIAWPIAPAPGPGTAYDKLKTWISSANNTGGGTQMATGLNAAIALLGTPNPSEEVYILALTDGADAGTAAANTAANMLKTTYNAEIWAVTLNNYDPGTIWPFMDGIASSASLSYKPYTQEAAAKVFDDFGEKVKGASGVVAGIKPNTTSYDIVQVPGKPLYELEQSDGNMTMTAVLNGNSFDWRWAGELKDGVLYSLSYYLQAKDGTPDRLYHDVLESSSFSYSYVDAGGMQQDVRIAFPTVYHAPNKGETKDEEGKLTPEATETKTDGYTGMDQHQDNRESAKTTIQTMSYSPNVKPLIGKLYAGTASNGRAKAIVEVENGTLMTYQWQFQDEASEKADTWTDIFGATSSQYTLSAKFKAGETYKLRCMITNPAGVTFLTDVLEVKATAANKTGALQSK